MENRITTKINALWRDNEWVVRRINSDGESIGLPDFCRHRNMAIYMVLLYSGKYPDATIDVPKSLRATVRKFDKIKLKKAKIFRNSLDTANNFRLSLF